VGFQYLAFSSLSRVTDIVVTRRTYKAKALCPPGYLIAQDIHMVAMIFSHTKLRIADCTTMTLRFIHFVAQLLGYRSALRAE
jgi:hypothetical protein